MINQQKYIKYLIHAPINNTCTHLSKNMDANQDVISQLLKNENLPPKELWENIKGLINNADDSCLIIEDSIENKPYSKSIKRVKQQCSGAVSHFIKNLAIINLVYTDGTKYYPINYRVYLKNDDGKTKNLHFQTMIINAVSDKKLTAKRVLFDGWYAAWQNLKLIQSLRLFFITTLKNDKLISLTKKGGWVHIADVSWDEKQLKTGIIIKLKKVPFKMKLFKLVAKNGDIDWVITNELCNTVSIEAIKNKNNLLGTIAQFHKALK